MTKKLEAVIKVGPSPVKTTIKADQEPKVGQKRTRDK